MTFEAGEKKLVITRHARDRFAEVYNINTDGSIKDGLRQSERVSPDVVWALTQRRGEADDRDSFWMSSDFLGIFVILEHPEHFYIQTFLRLSPSQQHIARGGKADELLAPGPTPTLRPDTKTYANEARSLLGSLGKGEALSPRVSAKILRRVIELSTYLDYLDQKDSPCSTAPTSLPPFKPTG